MNSVPRRGPVLLSAALILAQSLGACGPAPSASAPTSPVASQTPAASATPARPPTPDATRTPLLPGSTLSGDIDAFFQNLTDDHRFSGAVLVAQYGVVLLEKGYGQSDRAKGIANTAETRFRVSGLIEGLVATAVLSLQEQGRLSVQDPICDYLPTCPDDWQGVTLHHLLSHTSGLPTLEIEGDTLDEWLPILQDEHPAFTPGDYCAQNGWEYLLLAAVIESVTDQPAQAYLQSLILDPLTLTHTGWGAAPDDLALGYENLGDTVAVPPTAPAGLYSAYSTVGDLYRWNEALHGGRLVSSDSLDALFSHNATVPGWPQWSCGYAFVSRDQPTPAIEGFGFYWGFANVMHYYPDDQLTIIALINQGNITPWTVSFDLAEEVFDR